MKNICESAKLNIELVLSNYVFFIVTFEQHKNDINCFKITPKHAFNSNYLVIKL